MAKVLTERNNGVGVGGWVGWLSLGGWVCEKQVKRNDERTVSHFTLGYAEFFDPAPALASKRLNAEVF
jgi:hypothetical protein